MDLSWNSISSLGENTLVGLTSLTYLILSVNEISSVSPLAFRSLPALQTLALDNQHFYNYTNSSAWVLQNGTFSGNGNLTTLQLYTTGLKNVEAGAFKGLVRLESIDLSSGWPPNSISPPYPDFSDSAGLRYLSLEGTLCGSFAPPVASIPATFLKGLRNLSSLELSGNGCLHILPDGLFADQRPTLTPSISGQSSGGSCGGGLPASCEACNDVEISRLSPSCFSKAAP